jgi:hypothetical protein
MMRRAEAFQNAVALLRDLAPYDQCRGIVQMVYDGSLTHQEGKELLHALVDAEMDAEMDASAHAIGPNAGRLI